MLTLIGIIILSVICFPVMVPAILIAATTSATLWPTAGIILAVYIIWGVLFK